MAIKRDWFRTNVDRAKYKNITQKQHQQKEKKLALIKSIISSKMFVNIYQTKEHRTPYNRQVIVVVART
jgi:nicotinamide riboside transporter PnuC